MSLITVKDLSFSYDTLRIFENVSFDDTTGSLVLLEEQEQDNI